MGSVKPFLKWAGGKSRVLDQYDRYFPDGINRYFEPFIGGGAVFFHLRSRGMLGKKVYLFDNNEELINAYVLVRDNLGNLVHKLSAHEKSHSPEYYFTIRNKDRTNARMSSAERAARTIYLNKTCFNGLYRVNRKGEFNVPAGRYGNPKILDFPLLRNASLALRDAVIERRDFRTIHDIARSGDFFYFDPPYHPISRTSGFTAYTPGSFSEQDQIDLADLFSRLSRKECRCMLSNSHSPFILDLYKDFKIVTIQARRVINSRADGRGNIREVLVLNYPR